MVELNIEENMENFFIEPLLLVPFVENSFKHLSHYSNENANQILIDLSKENGEMKFSVCNTTEGKQMEIQQQGGIGLTNVKRRLELLYPQKHLLEITEENEWFDVQLKIKINN